MRKKFTMLFAALLACVGVAKAAATDLPELTTSTDDIKWYTIKNVRGNVYARYDGDGGTMNLTNAVIDRANLFYFTAGATEGTYKIHNNVNDLLCAAYNSWTAEGIDWYIQVSECTSHPGLAISKESTLTATGSEAWNDYQNKHTSINWYGGNDAGSTWEISKYEGDAPAIQLSTEGNIVLHYIRSNRRDSYVNFDGHNSTFKEGAQGLMSYWYFVQDAEAQQNAPEGFIACKIFNAAHATAVENFTTGFMETSAWPAKTFYIGLRENDNYGYIIRTKDDENNGWHDYSGSYIGSYGLSDNGSLFRIYPADKSTDDLKSEAATAVNNAKALADSYEFADYYSYSAEAEAAFRNAVEGLDVTSDFTTAISSAKTANAALSTLQATEKGAVAPAAGDVIQLKNKNYGTYLKPNGETLNGTSNKNDESTFWAVEAGDEGNVKLKNLSTGKYIGQIRQSANVAMVEATDAKQFAWTNQKDIYAVFKETSGGNYAYGHISGSNVLVGWEPNADATQWIVAQQTAEESLSTLVAVLEESKGLYGANVGQYAQTEAMTTAQSAAQALIDGESTDVISILTAAQTLQAEVAVKANLNLPVADKYYVLHNSYSGVYANVSNGAGMITTGSIGIGEVFQFVPAEGGNFYLKNVERGTFLSTALGWGAGQESATATTIESAVPVSIANLGKENQVSLTPVGGEKMHHDANYNTIVAWPGGADSRSSWKIEEVNIADYAHTVTISSVQWATLVLGYDAVIPVGVKAYAVSSVDTYANLTEITGAIPAGQAVLLNGADGNYEFKFAASAEAVATNLLKGSTVNTTVNEAAYILAAKEGVVGLYEVNLDDNNAFTNNAFKVYLPASARPEGTEAPAMFSFGRGEGTTGIEQIAGDAELVIYDLAGRRVEKMEKGIYIVNGKKVVIK